MKINIKRVIIAVIVGALLIGAWFKLKPRTKDGTVKIIHARIGNIQSVVSTTGTVLPKNRLEIKPPVNGRIEQIMVKEGDPVKTGQTIAWMSSTDRAALLDAARGQNEEAIKYWQEVYKPIPLIAPIDGQVIVGTTQPGQTVTASDDVIVLSDRLIVRAQVDETDIGKIKQGQDALVSLDAYPDTKIHAVVDHIYYESKTVNNVTIYSVDLVPDNVPDFFRSGMNANIDFIQESKKDVLVLPLNAVQKEEGEAFVLVQSENDKKSIKRPVTLGLSDDKKVEIVSGITEDDNIILKTRKYSLPKQASGGSNPFMPSRGGGRNR